MSDIIEKLRKENVFLNDMLENAHNRSRLLEEQLQQAQAELSRYKQGVEVESEVYAVAPNGQDVVGKVGIHVPENYIGQRVKVLVRAIEPSAERESKHDSI